MPQLQGSRFNTRRIACLAILLISAGAVALYLQYRRWFSPQRIAQAVEAVIEDLTGSEVRVGRAEMSIRGGLAVHDVEIRVPPDRLAGDVDFSSEDGLLLRAKVLKLKFHPGKWLAGKFEPTQISVGGVQLGVVHDTASGRWNWQLLWGTSQLQGRTWRFKAAPIIKVRDGTVSLTEIDGGQRTSPAKLRFDAQASPQGGHYLVRIDTRNDSSSGPSVRLLFDPQQGRISSGRVSQIDLAELASALPQRYRQWWQSLALTGKAAISQISYQQPAALRVAVDLDQVSAYLPVSKQQWRQFESGDSDRRQWVRVTDLTGRLAFTDHGVEVEALQGRLNGASCRIAGTYSGYSTAWDQVAFDLRLACKGFAAPDYTDPQKRQFIETHLPRKLRNFFADFKPKGKFDFQLKVTKPAGPNASVRIGGVLRPRQVSAEYYKFPYRIDRLAGRVTLKDGAFYLDKLEGRSGQARIEITGYVSQATGRAAVELQIHAAELALDEKLFRALPQKYRAIWTTFSPSGLVNCQVTLSRCAGAEKPWRRRIAAQLLNAEAVYKSFPYPLHRVTGRLQIDGDDLRIESLQAGNGAAKVSLEGRILNMSRPDPKVDLTIRSRDVPIDEKLLAALPDAVARTLQDCNLLGRVDLQGRIGTDTAGRVSYDLLCRFEDARLCYKDFPYPIEGLSGQLRIVPDKVTIEGAFARQGSAEVRAKGTVQLRQTSQRIDLVIEANNLPLDSRLYQALEPQQRRIWDAIRPSGTSDVTVHLQREAPGPWQWSIDSAVRDGRLHYDPLPVLTNLQGRVHLEPGLARFETPGLRGTIAGGTTMTLAGRITTEKRQMHAKLQLDAEKIPLDKPLVKWLDQMEIAKRLGLAAGGTIDLHVKELDIVKTASGQRWRMQGRIGLRDVLAVAISRTERIDAAYDGWISVDASQKLKLRGDLAIARLPLSARAAENVKMRLYKAAGQPVMIIERLSGQFCKGQLVGMGKVDLSRTPAWYALRLTLQDVLVDQCFDFQRTDPPIQGKLRGQIHLRGQPGVASSIQAGGRIEINHAEVLKIPLLAELYTAVHAKPPQLASFHDLTLEFVLDHQIMDFKRIDLRGQALSLLGYGTWNTSNDRLNLRLIAAGPGSLEQVPLLTELLRGASRELTEVQVRGTLHEARIRATPLRRLTEGLEMFLEGKYEQQDVDRWPF